jgi:hypothetical protein
MEPHVKLGFFVCFIVIFLLALHIADKPRQEDKEEAIIKQDCQG